MTDYQVSGSKSKEDFDELVLTKFPYPIASSYQKLLEATTWRAKIDEGLKIYEFGLRTVALVLINQYLSEDIAKVNDESFNQFLLSQLPEATLGSWVDLFFRSLKVYEGKPTLFFTRELYGILWDTSIEPHVKRDRVRTPFQRLVELRNARAHLRLADTEENAQEVLHNLQATLAQFAFIHKYDLIRITEKLDEEHCHYDIYRGLTVVSDNGRLKLWRKGDKQLHENWFYLLRKTPKGREVLELHPFLVAWISASQKTDEEKSFINSGVALYDRLLKTKVTYISIPDQVLVEHERPLLDQIRSIFYFVIEEQRMGQGGRTRFSWAQLKAAAQELSTRNMRGVQQKYHPELYLQREETFQQFNDFLASDKTCFVLTGKSGVGKSNFVLSLGDAYAEQDHLCYLMYDGARLSVTEEMQDTISQDLGRRLELVDTMRQNLFATIENHGLMTHRKLLIVFDAINENANGKELLQKIDKLVDIGEDFPWLKVLITCRPQAWRTLKRGLRLAQENYFQSQGVDDLAVEMSEFAIKLEEFERDELELAYEKYRIVYRLRTTYNSLPVSIRETLKDPLVLRLVADIYREKALPETVRVSDIYEKYVDALVETNRLEHEDIIFLKQEIVPRMFSVDRFDNKLVAAQITQARTENGRPLWEMIRVSEQLSGGEAINASYQRLANAEILIQQGSPTEYEISFKYERFYEHFGGIFLFYSAQKADNLIEYYEKVSNELEGKPYLWGVLKNALFSELKQENFPVVFSLAAVSSLKNRLLRDAIVFSLVEFGEIEPNKIIALVNELIQPCYGPASTLSETLQRFVRRKQFDAKLLRPAQSIAIEVAGRLGLEDFLLNAATDRIRTLRQAATLQIFHVWRDDSEAGFRMIHQLSDYAVTAWRLPDLGTLDSLISLVISTVVYDHLNPTVQKSALKIGRHVLRELLLLNPEERPTIIGQIRRRIAKLIRRPLLNLSIDWGLRILTSWNNNLAANTDTLSDFFTLSATEKQALIPIIPFLDPRHPGLSNHVEHLMACQDTGDFFMLAVAETTPIIRAENNFEDAVQTLREMVERSFEFEPPRPHIQGLAWIALQLAMRQEKPNEELFNLGVRCIMEIQNDPYRWWGRMNEAVVTPFLPPTCGMGLYIMFATHYDKNLDSLPLGIWIERAIQNEDYNYVESYVSNELQMVFDMGFYRAAINGLRYIASVNKSEVKQAVIELLIRIRRYYPEAVEDMILQEVFSKEINQRVLATSTSERLNDLYGLKAAAILYDLFLMRSDILRAETIWLADKSLKINSLQNFVALIIKEVLNLAAGEVIFPMSEDSPARMYLQHDGDAY